MRQDLMKDIREIVTDKDLIYVDCRQDVCRAAGSDKSFSVEQLPVSDYAFLTDDDRLVGIEEKKPRDLENSHAKRRLQRQLRALKQSTDVPILGLRFIWDHRTAYDQYYLEPIVKLYPDLAKWARIGHMLLLPPEPLEFLKQIKPLFNTEPKEVLSIVAGSDLKKRKEHESKFVQGMIRLIKGCGMKTAVKVEAYFQGNFLSMMGASSDELVESGLHKGQVKQILEYRGSNGN
jgi:hypothetical protein